MEQQNNYHRGLGDVALGIYELINHDILPMTGQEHQEREEIEAIGDNISYINTQMHLQTQMNFGFGPKRSPNGSVDEYATVDLMNRTQDLGKLAKRNLLLNKTQSQMKHKRG